MSIVGELNLLKEKYHYCKRAFVKCCSYGSPSSLFWGPPKGHYTNIEAFLKEKKGGGRITPLHSEMFNDPTSTVSFCKKGKIFHKETSTNLRIQKQLNVLYDGRIHLDPWAFISSDDKLLFEESSCYGPEPEDHWIFRRLQLSKAKKLKGKVLFLSCRKNYWHLLMDEIPMLFFLQQGGIELTDYDYIICENYQYRACVELHEMFGIKSQRVVPLSEYKHLLCKELHFVTGTYALSPQSVIFARGRILNSLELKFPRAKDGGRKIIVSRNDSETRRWLNEEKCTKTLTELGFEVVTTSRLSLKDQVNIFRQATIIIGIHGAGLTNALFMNQGSIVVEIRTSQQEGEYSSAECYQQLSQIMRHQHYVYLTKGHERKELKGRSIEDADLNPDVDDLFHFVREHINQNRCKKQQRG